MFALRRFATKTTAVSSGTRASSSLTNIPARWNRLPEHEKAYIADSLRNKLSGDWRKVSREDKAAAYWIAYGPHNSRRFWKSSDTKFIAFYFTATLAVGAVLWDRIVHRAPLPESMNPENIDEQVKALEEAGNLNFVKFLEESKNRK